MIRSCLVLAAVFQVLFGQESGPDPRDGFRQPVPHYCLSPPPGTDLHKCCPIPKLFPDGDMERCGIEKASVDQSKSPPKPRIPCKESICLMQNANMLLANHSVDYEKLRTFVDIWADSNPEFTEAILEAKKACAKDGGPSGPPVCEQDRIFYCLTSNVLWNCKLRDFEDCRVLKAHMDECRPYYWKKREEDEANAPTS
ncbi:hypothetical protein PYW07_003141 [Mythimna separata]|uniref:Odorant-binding protein 4 n=1 Tax=Mythimna separata TaxID=271217 RepID=A0A5H2N9J0_MYTSE|nr:odorant-binding protein 4 [Mythimna separata]KAJ8716514.1 hypothetical protein PYW07_003141 [Mythimna separata]